MKQLLILLLCFAICSCASEDVLSDTKSEEMSLDTNDVSAMLKNVHQMAADKSCQAATDCQLIGVGARPCGGPDEYLIYSRETTDEAQLKTLVTKYNQLISNSNKKNGVVGICVVATKPRIGCHANQCTQDDSAISNQL